MYNIEQIKKNSKKIENNWTIIQNFPVSKLNSLILGKKIEMKAKCELFPKFRAKGTVHKIEQKTASACLIYVKQNQTSTRVDGGMTGLSYRICN